MFFKSVKTKIIGVIMLVLLIGLSTLSGVSAWKNNQSVNKIIKEVYSNYFLKSAEKILAKFIFFEFGELLIAKAS